MRQPARGYATEHQSNQSFQPDVPPEMQKDFASASEIDLRNFQNRPARIVPSSPSYFTASPKTTDILLGLERLLAKYESLPTVHANDAPKMAWLRAPDFAATINEELPTKKYRAIMKIVQRLNLIELTLAPKEVRLQLEQFLRPGNPYGTKSAPQQVDEMGRARGKGKRKTCSAVAYLVEGEGEFMVNGKSLLETFGRMHDRESASWALRSTQRLDKYNVFAITKGGGVTGQAEAIMLAVAKALVVHEPGLKTYLRKSTLHPPSEISVLTCHSWCYHGGSPTSGKKEAWSPQGPQDASVGQEVNHSCLVQYFDCVSCSLHLARLGLDQTQENIHLRLCPNPWT